MGHSLLDDKAAVSQFGANVLQLSLTSSRYDAERDTAAADQPGALQASGSVIRLFASGSAAAQEVGSGILTGSGLYFLKPTTDNLALSKPARILGHNLDETISGDWTFSSALSVQGDVDLGNETSDTITATGRFDSDLVPSTDGARDLGASGLEWKDLYIDGVAYVDSLQADQLGAALDANSQAITNINVDSGAIDGVTLGSNSAITALVVNAGVNIDDDGDGAIDGCVVGGSTPAAGTFTTLTANDQLVVAAGATITGDTTNEITLAIAGVASQTADMFKVSDSDGNEDLSVDASGVTTARSLVATTADINAGTIDNAVIGATTARPATFTTCDATTDFTVGSTVITDDSIVMTPSSGDTLSITSTTNGASTIATVDDSGTDADLALTADGQITYRANDAAGHIFDINGTSQVQLVDGVLKPTTTNDVDLGTNSLLFKSIYAHDVRLNGSLSASYIAVDHLDVNTINSVVRTESTLEIADKHIVLASGSAGGAVNGAGLLFGGDGSERGLTEAGSLTWDSELNGVVISGSTANQVAHVSASGDVYGNDGHFVNRLTVKNDGNIGSDGAYDAMTISSAGIVTFKDDILIKSAGSIGTADVNDSLTWNADGDLTFKDGAYDLDIASHDGDNGLKLGGSLVTSDAAELNLLDGSAADTVVNSKAVIYSSGGNVNASSMTVENGGTIGSAGDTSAITIAANGACTFSDSAVFTGGATFNAMTTVSNGNTFSALGNVVLGNADTDVIGVGGMLTASYGLSVASGQDVYFVGGNGARLVDNSSNALDFREGDNSYLKFVTTNNEESIDMGVDLNLAAGASVTADAFVLNSDETLKKDIKTLDSALDKVMSMRGVTYQFKHNPEKQEVGFLAQEMKNSVPEVVSTTNQGTLGIDYAKLTSVLVEAVKEQQEQIEELKAKLSKDNS